MDEAKRELVERLIHAAAQMRAAPRTAAEDWPEIDLTMQQLRALSLLGEGPQRMGEIAAFLGNSVSATTSLIERLEGKSFVTRVHDPHDRRVVLCHLTAEGQAILDRFWRMQQAHLQAVAALLTLPELTTVVGAMELLVAAIKRHARALESAPTEAAADPAAMR